MTGFFRTEMKRKILAVLAVILLLPLAGFAADAEDQTNKPSAIILNKYLQATQNHEDDLRGASMDVDIYASVPKLKEHGKLLALRKISKVGQITYRVLGFEGDNTVKNQVIARYLQAEQQGQGDMSLAVIPANYKFKYKGEKPDPEGRQVYVFQVSPRKKKVGLFKGEIEVDAATYLPLMEKGRFVKNPSIFFKKVEFLRTFVIKNGVAVPENMSSTIDARLIGKIELSINYSNYTPNAADDEQAATGSETAAIPGSAVK
jgi:outer membrane lipoprotein-sorting protein